MKNFIYLFLLVSIFYTYCTASHSRIDEKSARFKSTPCLKMLSEIFQKPDDVKILLPGSMNFEEIVLSDDLMHGNGREGVIWRWRTPCIYEGQQSIWSTMPCKDTNTVPDQRYALSFWHLRDFYNSYKQLSDGSNMKALWHFFFNNNPDFNNFERP